MTNENQTYPIPTIEGIVDDILKNLPDEDRVYIATAKLNDIRGLHHTFGMWIRNHYGLWSNNPLTERWRTDESSHDIRDGVDYSKDHPDNLSDKIIERLWYKAQGM
jgi:hypothetical protein